MQLPSTYRIGMRERLTRQPPSTRGACGSASPGLLHHGVRIPGGALAARTGPAPPARGAGDGDDEVGAGGLVRVAEVEQALGFGEEAELGRQPLVWPLAFGDRLAHAPR